MSYCVNCGVELDASAKKCALCSTEVINPNIKIEKKPEKDKPFADELQIPPGIKKRFIGFVITVAILIPNIVMFFLNVFILRDGFWSVTVFLACLYIWILCVFPSFIKKINPYLLWCFDSLATIGFLFLFSSIFSINKMICYCILSIVAALSLAILIMIFWIRRKKRHWTSIVVVTFLGIAIISIVAGLSVSVISEKYTAFVIGLIICICAVVMMGFFIYCNRSKHVRAWLNKVFYL